MHKIKPLKTYRIITIKVAIPDDADFANNEISEALNKVLAEENSILVDWAYKKEYSPEVIVQSSAHPYEGELFGGKL